MSLKMVTNILIYSSCVKYLDNLKSYQEKEALTPALLNKENHILLNSVLIWFMHVFDE